MDAITSPTDGIGELLRQHRARAGLTQEALAERAGLSARGVQDIERGLSTPQRETLRRLVSALELDDLARRELEAAGRRRPPTVIRTNLPRQLTSFVGRQRELADIQSLMATSRLLTLTGVGGCGKTRLALEAARGALPRYPEGVWLVELSALADGGLVTQTVSQVLGVRELPGEPMISTLVTALRPRHLLLILDNCEHVLAACIEIATRLASACPHVMILATSREVLGVGYETVWRVPPLSLPTGQASGSLEHVAATSEAAALFVERAEAALPGFASRSQNGASLAEVCRRLDGIPLAIELAAARVRLLGLEQLVERVGDRLRLLSTGNKAAPTRQQTLQATVAWSYALLSEPERRLFENLSVFAGGWTLEAAEAVGGEATDSDGVLQLLGRLVDKSLVLAEPTPELDQRYRLLETLRQYADQKLAERGARRVVRKRHAEYFLRLFEDLEREILGASFEAGLQRLEYEHDNLRVALSWMLAEDEPELALRLAGAAYPFWYLHGYFREGRDCVGQALALDTQAPTQGTLDPNHALVCASTAASPALQADVRRLAARARALHGVANLAIRLCDFDLAHQASSEGLLLCRQLHDDGAASWALASLGQLALYRMDYSQARQLFRESVAAGTGTPNGQASAAISLALSIGPGAPGLAWPSEDVVCQERPLGEVIDAAEEALRITRAHEHRIAVCWFLLSLGALHRLRRDYATARAFWEEGLVRTREAGFKLVMAPTLTKLGELETEQGHIARASSLLADSLRLSRELSDRVLLANSLEAVVGLAIAIGQPERAFRIAAAAAGLRQTIGVPLCQIDQAKLEESLAAVRERLDAAAADRLSQEGARLPLDEIIRDAREMLEEAAQRQGTESGRQPET
jgi:predicted ATPase/DNA-binding XRE family transcriptional regulator